MSEDQEIQKFTKEEIREAATALYLDWMAEKKGQPIPDPVAEHSKYDAWSDRTADEVNTRLEAYIKERGLDEARAYLLLSSLRDMVSGDMPEHKPKVGSDEHEYRQRWFAAVIDNATERWFEFTAEFKEQNPDFAVMPNPIKNEKAELETLRNDSDPNLRVLALKAEQARTSQSAEVPDLRGTITAGVKTEAPRRRPGPVVKVAGAATLLVSLIGAAAMEYVRRNPTPAPDASASESRGWKKFGYIGEDGKLHSNAEGQMRPRGGPRKVPTAVQLEAEAKLEKRASTPDTVEYHLTHSADPDPARRHIAGLVMKVKIEIQDELAQHPEYTDRQLMLKLVAVQKALNEQRAKDELETIPDYDAKVIEGTVKMVREELSKSKEDKDVHAQEQKGDPKEPVGKSENKTVEGSQSRRVIRTSDATTSGLGR